MATPEQEEHVEKKNKDSPPLQSYLLALVQLNSTPDIEKNLNIAEGCIRKAAEKGAQLIGLPECTPFLGPEELLIKKIEEIENGFFPTMRRLSKELSVAIFAGGYRKAAASAEQISMAYEADFSKPQKKAPEVLSFSKKTQESSPAKEIPSHRPKAYNCLFYADAGHKQEFIYDKVHLFDVSIPDGVSYEESRYIEPGKNPCPLLKNTPFGNLGFSICYDLRFPEMYRRLSGLGADTLLLPAAFTAYTGRAHWHTLVRARAIENLSYVFAPAQTGLHFGKRRSFGHSLVVSPWGELLGELDDGPGILLVEIKREAISEARRRLPVLENQKPF